MAKQLIGFSVASPGIIILKPWKQAGFDGVMQFEDVCILIYAFLVMVLYVSIIFIKELFQENGPSFSLDYV